MDSGNAPYLQRYFIDDPVWNLNNSLRATRPNGRLQFGQRFLFEKIARGRMKLDSMDNVCVYVAVYV